MTAAVGGNSGKPKFSTKKDPTPSARSRRREGDNAAPLGKQSVLTSSKKVLAKTPTHNPPETQDQPSVVTPWRVWMNKLTRYSPIRQLDPETLGRFLDQFAAGTLRYMALMMDAVANRDDILQSVIPKRKGAVSRRTLEVILDPDADPVEAEKHAAKLRYFYKNATATNARMMISAMLMTGSLF